MPVAQQPTGTKKSFVKGQLWALGLCPYSVCLGLEIHLVGLEEAQSSC